MKKLLFVFIFIFHSTFVFAMEEYIPLLDIKVQKTNNGVKLISIGEFSPLRRYYSNFRKNDVLMYINNQEVSVYLLMEVKHNDIIFIILKRNNTIKRFQIDIKKVFYSTPSYIQRN